MTEGHARQASVVEHVVAFSHITRLTHLSAGKDLKPQPTDKTSQAASRVLDVNCLGTSAATDTIQSLANRGGGIAYIS